MGVIFTKGQNEGLVVGNWDSQGGGGGGV